MGHPNTVLDRLEVGINGLLDRMRGVAPLSRSRAVWPWSVGWPWALGQAGFTAPSPAQPIRPLFLAVDVALTSLALALVLGGGAWVLGRPFLGRVVLPVVLAVAWLENLLGAWAWNRRASRLGRGSGAAEK